MRMFRFPTAVAAGLALLSALLHAPAASARPPEADPPARAEPAWWEPPRGPAPSGLLSSADSLKLELAGLFAILSWSGWNDWKWGSASFRFNSEGWLGMNTGSGGQDKIGHGFSSYLMAEFMYLRLRTYYGPDAAVTVYPALFSWVLMLYVEFFDGFSVDHGFSYEDLVMDAGGVGAAFFRQAVPEVGRAFDLRMEYYPSQGMQGMHPMIDYSGQKFLLAVKPAELGLPKESGIYYLELLLGYYTRGFQKGDGPYFPDKRATVFLGLGGNLDQLLFARFGKREDYNGTVLDYAHAATNYFQMPRSYLSTELHTRTAPADRPRR
jgi:hypothetical protein